MAGKRVKKTSFQLSSIIGFILTMIFLVVVIRMVLLISERSRLATERRDAAKQELLEVESLASKFENEAYRLESTEGKQQALRNRYGIVSENEGYLILLHDHEQPDRKSETGKDWRLW